MNAETVNLVLERDVPIQAMWNGVRYYVDAPPVPYPAVTDKRDPAYTGLRAGWRFRGSSADGESHLFDVNGWGASGWARVSVQD